MRLYALKLYQRILFALTVLLLVMNLEQVWCNAQNAQKIKFMYNKQSQSFVTMHNNGTVSTVTGEAGLYMKSHQCMRYCTVMKGTPILLSIYNPATRRYLCFNKGRKRFVGMRKLTENCYFTENTVNAYYVYKLYTQRKRVPVLAFKKSGELIPSYKLPPLNGRTRETQLFLTVYPLPGECDVPSRDAECPDVEQPPLRHNKHRDRERRREHARNNV